eukprot:Selendium_serpulae@DN5645_c0_g2_i5.p1
MAGGVRAPSSFRGRTPRTLETRSMLYSHKLDGQPIRGPIQPIQGFVLVEQKEWVKESAGGVLLAPQSKKEQCIGKVLAVGEGAISQQTGYRVPMPVTVGDWVLFSPHSDSFKYDGKDCTVTRADLVQATIHSESGDIDPLNVKPLNDSVLVKVLKPPSRTESGLILSAGAKADNNAVGEVIAIGPGGTSDSGSRLPMEVGNKILDCSSHDSFSYRLVSETMS